MKKRIPLTGSQSGEVAQVEFDPEQTGPWVVGGGPERTRAGAVGQAWGGGGREAGEGSGSGAGLVFTLRADTRRQGGGRHRAEALLAPGWTGRPEAQ